MSDDEIKAKEEELKEREGDLTKREQGLNEREELLAKREADANSIAATLKEEYEKRLEAQKVEFEERLKQRDEVIRQLASGETTELDPNDPFTQLNNRRRAQKAA